jgi:hypothetical protein
MVNVARLNLLAQFANREPAISLRCASPLALPVQSGLMAEALLH